MSPAMVPASVALAMSREVDTLRAEVARLQRELDSERRERLARIGHPPAPLIEIAPGEWR